MIQGRLLRAQGDLDGSIATYSAALEERIAVSGMNHPETAALYNSLAVAHMHANHFNAALIAYRKALAIQDALQRTDDLDAQIMRGNMGMLAFRYGQVDDAENTPAHQLHPATRARRRLGGGVGGDGLLRHRFAACAASTTKRVSVLRTAVSMASEFAGPASPVAVQNRLFPKRSTRRRRRARGVRAPLLDENLGLARKQLGEENLAVLRTRLGKGPHGDSRRPRRSRRSRARLACCRCFGNKARPGSYRWDRRWCSRVRPVIATGEPQDAIRAAERSAAAARNAAVGAQPGRC